MTQHYHFHFRLRFEGVRGKGKRMLVVQSRNFCQEVRQPKDGQKNTFLSVDDVEDSDPDLDRLI
jgi:hypothetical protein